ncbi:MAG TPA: YqiA/YcfP family alpha/beta fold hydrolase [Burkholderiaceae bacterium]
MRPARPPEGARAPLTHLLYLHGFRSSPRSAKARWMAAWVAAHRPDLAWLCPQLPPSPAEAMAGLRALVRDWPAATGGVVGSSLGGFYATAIAEEFGFRAVVINPAVDPARDLAAHIGRQTSWHAPGEDFDFTAAHVDELRAIAPPAELAHPERILAIVAKGDEVLDWREMSARYARGPLKLIEGGDHGLVDFDPHAPDLLRHLGLA